MSTPKEVDEFIKMLNDLADRISGVSSLKRGDPLKHVNLTRYRYVKGDRWNVGQVYCVHGETFKVPGVPSYVYVYDTTGSYSGVIENEMFSKCFEPEHASFDNALEELLK